MKTVKTVNGHNHLGVLVKIQTTNLAIDALPADSEQRAVTTLLMRRSRGKNGQQDPA